MSANGSAGVSSSSNTANSATDAAVSAMSNDGLDSPGLGALDANVVDDVFALV
jgi:hypothetical protein